MAKHYAGLCVAHLRPESHSDQPLPGSFFKQKTECYILLTSSTYEKAVLQKQVDEKGAKEKKRKEIRKIKGDKEAAGFDNQDARKILIRTLLIVSIDLFQNNLRLIRLGRTIFYYE